MADSSDVVLPTSSAIDAKNECPNCHAKSRRGAHSAVLVVLSY